MNKHVNKNLIKIYFYNIFKIIINNIIFKSIFKDLIQIRNYKTSKDCNIPTSNFGLLLESVTTNHGSLVRFPEFTIFFILDKVNLYYY